MSALAPLIASHRALGNALQAQAAKPGPGWPQNVDLLQRLGGAHLAAAADLEEQVRAGLGRASGDEPMRGAVRSNCLYCGPLGPMEEHGEECPRYPAALPRDRASGDQPAPINETQVPGTLAPNGTIWSNQPGRTFDRGTVKIHRYALAAAKAAGWREVVIPNGLPQPEVMVVR